MSQFRVMYWNVRGLVGDGAALSEVVRSARPDILVAAEGPGRVRWQPRTAALARRCGMIFLGGGSPAGGTVLASSIGVEWMHGGDSRLPAPHGVARRGLAVALCRIRGARVAIAGTRLGEDPTVRACALGPIGQGLSWVEPVPMVLAGDLDAVATSAVLGRDLRDALVECGAGQPVPGSRAPLARSADTVLIDGRIRPVHAEVLDSAAVRRASDHRPVVVDLAVD